MLREGKLAEWFALSDGYESVGSYILEFIGEDAKCPRCGKQCDYWEGMVEQDRMGNDLGGYSWDCYKCGIGSEWAYVD